MDRLATADSVIGGSSMPEWNTDRLFLCEHPPQSERAM